MRSVFLIAIVAVAMIGMMIPSAFADDFVIETKCEGQNLIISLVDQDGEIVQNAVVRTADGISGKSNIFEKFSSGENGIVSINFEDNTGFVHISKGGYNTQKINVETCSQKHVPSWIKTNAEWWTQGMVDEKTFLNGIKFLINENIIEIPDVIKNEKTSPDCIIYQTGKNISTRPGDSESINSCVDAQIGQKIPLWIVSNIEWWVDGQINDDTFLQGIEFLVANQIIDVNDKENSNVIATDKNLPSIKTFEKFVDNKWEIQSGPSAYCYNLVGLEDSRQISALIYDGWIGEATDTTYIVAEICDFNKLTNAERAWTGSTSYDNELFENADFAGHSETSGNCFFLPLERFEGMDYSYAGCTYGTSIIGVSIDSTNYLDSEWTNDIIFTMMDEMLANVNQMKHLEYENSFKDIIKLDYSFTSNSGVSTGEITADEGFSGLYCSQDGNWVQMTGQYTNGPDYYSTVYFTLGILDNNGRIVATGIGDVSNIAPYQTKMFDATAKWSGDFKECIIEVDTAFP